MLRALILLVLVGRGVFQLLAVSLSRLETKR